MRRSVKKKFFASIEKHLFLLWLIFRFSLEQFREKHKNIRDIVLSKLLRLRELFFLLPSKIFFFFFGSLDTFDLKTSGLSGSKVRNGRWRTPELFIWRLISVFKTTPVFFIIYLLFQRSKRSLWEKVKMRLYREGEYFGLGDDTLKKRHIGQKIGVAPTLTRSY